jgi:adenylylsulfate kinase
MVKNNIIVYVKANLETCKSRDKEGKYKKAISGEYKNFTGISDVYEEPQHAELIIDTDILSIDEAVEKIVKYIKTKYIK